MIRAMPERKRFFSIEVFPYDIAEDVDLYENSGSTVVCEAHDRDGVGDFHGVGDGDVEEEEYCGGDVHDVGVGCIDEDDGEDGRRVVREAHVCRGLLNFWPPRQLVERASTIPHIVLLLVVLLLLQDGEH